MDRTLIIRFDARTLVLGGAMVVMVSAFLPWVSLPSFLVGDLAQRGLEAGGWATLVLGFLAALSLLLPWRPLNRVSLPAAGLSVFVHLIGLAAFVHAIQLATALEINTGNQLGAVGSGLILTFAGAWLMLFGGLGNAAPPPSLMWNRGWMGCAAWGGLLVVVLASCLCAWSIGLIVQPYTLASPAQPVATFGPAPTGYMATPLIDVQLEPLGNTGTGGPAAVLTPTESTPSPVSATVTNPIGPSTATRPANPINPTSTVHFASPTSLASPTSPAYNTAVASPTVQTVTFTPSPTVTVQSFTVPASPSATPTRTSTPIPPSSPLQTPTPSSSPLQTPAAP